MKWIGSQPVLSTSEQYTSVYDHITRHASTLTLSHVLSLVHSHTDTHTHTHTHTQHTHNTTLHNTYTTHTLLLDIFFSTIFFAKHLVPGWRYIVTPIASHVTCHVTGLTLSRGHVICQAVWRFALQTVAPRVPGKWQRSGARR